MPCLLLLLRYADACYAMPPLVFDAAMIMFRAAGDTLLLLPAMITRRQLLITPRYAMRAACCYDAASCLLMPPCRVLLP